MDNLILSLLSGLLGALIGAFAGICAVRHSHVLQMEAALRNLLVEQHVAVRMLDSTGANKKQQSDFREIYKAYQNLRSVTGRRRRRLLDSAWRKYKGNYEDVVPLFGEQTVGRNGTSTSVSTRQFTREEVMEKIEQFLQCLS